MFSIPAGRSPFVLAALTLMLLGPGRAAAQTEPAAPDVPPGGAAEGSDEIQVDEEITVVGQRSLRLLRAEVQLERERVYGLFNSLNSDDEFDIRCVNVPRTGTRITQRVCRPQYSENVTGDASRDFLLVLQSCGGLSESCLEQARSRAQGIVSEVPVKDQQFDAEVQRLTRDNPEFRRAIADYQAVERRYDMARREVASGLRVSAAVIEPAAAAVPSELDLRRDDVVAPEPIDLATPAAPWSETDESALREGWVKLRFSVLANGTTADVRVVDTMPPGLDASSPAAAAAAWTFEPATADGTPIDWHNALAIVTVRREQAVHEGWPDFADAYEAVAALVAEERYEEAKARNAQMLAELAVTLDEMAFAEMQRALIEHALGNSHVGLDAIRRATEPAVAQLADEQLQLALGHRFSLELELGLAAEALATYERRTALDRVPSRDPMARNAAALERALARPETGLAAQRRIGDERDPEHSLTWPTFAIGNVDGAIDALNVECNRGKAALPMEEDMQLTVPAGWGNCVVFVDGEPGTTFTVFELQALVEEP